MTSNELLSIEKKVIGDLLLAGKRIVELWQSSLTVLLKDRRDIVTNADVEIEDFLKNKLRSYVPNAGYLLEEGNDSENTEYQWVIDPIDGTKYFAYQTPLFMSQIALLRNNEPILGVINVPLASQVFSASLKNGARLNGKDLHPLPTRPIEDSIVEIDFGGIDKTLEWKISIFEKLVKHCYRCRMTSGFLSPYITTGSIDAMINVSNINLNKKKFVVDNAPRIIIIQESGLTVEMVTTRHGNVVMLAGNNPLIASLRSFID